MGGSWFPFFDRRNLSGVLAVLNRQKRIGMGPLRSHVLDEVCNFDRSDRKVIPEGNSLSSCGRCSPKVPICKAEMCNPGAFSFCRGYDPNRGELIKHEA